MKSTESVPIAEAAARAAALYVWNGSHEKGAKAGWSAGWAAAIAEITEEAAQHGAREDHNPADSARIEEDEVSSPRDEIYELNPEWAALFVDGAARRAAERRADALDRTKRSRVALDLGGAAEAARINEAKNLYGDNAKRLLETEAEMLATFDERVANAKAGLWPVLSIRDGEAPRGGR